jgi:hypothetical protein
MAATGASESDSAAASDYLERQLSDRERTRRKERRRADVPGWGDSTPSGLRDRVDQDEAEELAARERQKQHVTEQDRRVRTFDRTQFVAHVSDRINYNRNGDMQVTLQIPYQFKHLAEPLTDAEGA